MSMIAKYCLRLLRMLSVENSKNVLWMADT
jgi:hypothetical protein